MAVMVARLSPRLIQLGIEETDLSMMYLISQGKVTGLSINNTYWGYNKLRAVDSTAQMCYAYEEIPACLDLDYDPGGSLSWTTTVTQSGPSGAEGSFTTPPGCIKIAISYQSIIRVTGSAASVNGYSGSFTMQQPKRYLYGGHEAKQWYKHDSAWMPPTNSAERPTEMSILWTRSGYTESSFWYGQTQATARYFSYGSQHRSVTIDQTSEVRVDYSVINIATGKVERSGRLWIKHGATNLTIDNLPAAEYRVVFDEKYEERGANFPTYTVSEPRDNLDNYYKWSAVIGRPRGKVTGFSRKTYAGSEQEVINSTVVMTIYNELEFPDVPGGGQQLVGGLSDLTMMGIRGDI